VKCRKLNALPFVFRVNYHFPHLGVTDKRNSRSLKKGVEHFFTSCLFDQTIIRAGAFRIKRDR
jgi:hypothetical protein